MAKNFIEDLQKKISPILEKIPFLSKKNDDDEEYEDEEDEESEAEDTQSKSSIISEDKTNPKFDKTSNKINIPKADEEDEEVDDDSTAQSEEEDEDEEEEDEDEITEGEKSQNKRKKIIQLIIALGVVYFVADEVMNSSSSDEEIVIPDPPAQTQKKRPKKIEEPAIQAQQVENEAQKVQEVIEPPQEETVQEAIKEEEPVEESVVEEKQVEEIVETAKVRQGVSVNDTTMDSDVLKMDEIESKTEEESNPLVNDEGVTNDNESSQMSEKEQIPSEEIDKNESSSLDSQLTNIMKSVEKENEQKQFEYVSPPNYENFGESLVYNCKGKHWACVDKQAHFQCLYNYRWSKQNSKKPECSNSKVLASGKDCRMLQLYNINMIVETPDCN